MPPPTQKQFDDLKKQVEALKGTVKKQADKIKSGTGSSSTKEFELGGGFFDFIKEGSQLYELRKDSFKNTGLLLDELAGPAGFISKFAKLAEGDVEIFGGIDNTVQAFNDLGASARSFSMTSEEMQSKLGTTLAVFKELGVGVEDFAAVLDSARLGFGMSEEAADKLARSVANVGLATGVGMGEATKNFRSAQSSMAYDSKKLMENFKQLQFTAGATGISFDKLTSAFGDSMDTFEGSAGKAGNLNAILGRSVFNSIDLLGKTEAERVSTIVEGIRKSTDVQALSKNKFQLKAVAEGLGLTPDETRKLLTGQTSVDEALAGKTSKDPREKALSKMAELMKDGTNPELEKFIGILKKSRTELANSGAELNAIQRKAMQRIVTMASAKFGEGITANTTGELFTYFEGAIMSLKENLSTSSLRQLKEDFSSMKTDLLSATGDEQRQAVMEKMFERLSINRRGSSTEGRTAATPSTAAARAKPGKILSTEVVAGGIEEAGDSLAAIGKKLSVAFTGAVKFMVGETEMQAYIVDTVNKMPVKK